MLVGVLNDIMMLDMFLNNIIMSYERAAVGHFANTLILCECAGAKQCVPLHKETCTLTTQDSTQACNMQVLWNWVGHDTSPVCCPRMLTRTTI